MINCLRIQNVAIIEEVEVFFAPGLNILTGETGAGKSIVVDSIGFLLGGRPARDFVRTGADFAHVEGIIEVGRENEKELEALGVFASDGQIMLSRTMQAQKSICRINGRTVTAALLKDVATIFVDLHGQNEHQSLLDTSKQLELVDGFCGGEMQELKETLGEYLGEYRKANKALRAIVGVGDERTKQIELLRYQLMEITIAKLKKGEEEELLHKKNRLAGSEKLLTNTLGAIWLIFEAENGDSGMVPASTLVGDALKHTNELQKLDPGMEGVHTRLEGIHSELLEIGYELGNYREKLDCEPGELERVESRLDFLYHIKKKYGNTIEDVLSKKVDLEMQLEKLENSEIEVKNLKKRLRELTEQIVGVCASMNAKRQEAADYISGEVTKILHEVGMEDASFRVEIIEKKAFGADGNSEAEFRISPNPGEPLKQLRRIASGGEMSRVMLAIKTVMAEVDRVSTVIFDEVDAGISGRTAQKVAEKLAAVSKLRQILCITHLPQIAAMADIHFQIEKSVLEKDDTVRTVTTVNNLPPDKAVSELARLIGGRSITDSTMKAAREMKVEARKIKGG